MVDERVKLSTADALTVPADAIVVEDSGWLTASRGLAASVDGLNPELRARREQALALHGGPYAIGAALGFPLHPTTHTLRHAIWTITFTYIQQPEQRDHLVRATPLDIAAAARSALLEAIELKARHIIMPAIGTRTDYHVLPPVPKKLPRYVMGAAQMIGIQQALQTDTTIESVTLALSQRDYAIFHDLLGLPSAESIDEDTSDE
ncbi:MAG TPA: hypothetical protein VFZ66_05410 [Herpetosiphonaceae bacterium]